MKLNNEKVEIKTIVDFMVHFNNIDYYIEELATSIGTRDDKRKILVPTQMDIDPDTLTTEGASKTVTLKDGTKKKLVLINNQQYFLEGNYGFPGLNQINDNPYLYLAIQPLSVNKKLSENKRLTNPMPVGEQQVSNIINTIANQHPQENSSHPITFIILGDRNTHENLHIYEALIGSGINNYEGLDSDFLLLKLPHLDNETPALSKEEQQPENEEKAEIEDIAESEQKVENKEKGEIQDNLAIEEVAAIEENIESERKAKAKGASSQQQYPRERDANLYYLNAVGNTITLTSDGINHLYLIYKETILSGNPLVIHDNEGTEKAAKIALAFEIVRNFQTCFKTFVNETTCGELEKVIDRLRCSFSPKLLTNVDFLTQAVYLAFALKTYEYEDNLLNGINGILGSKKDNAKFQSRAEKISTMLDDLKKCSTYKEKYLSLFKSLTKNYAELSSSEGFFTRGKELFTGTKSEPYQVLNTLRFVYEKRANEIEPLVLDFLVTGELKHPVKENGHNTKNNQVLEFPEEDFVQISSLGK